MIAVVIVNYRNPQLTIQSVMSVYEHAGMPVQVLLVDNSEDNGISIAHWKAYNWPEDFAPKAVSDDTAPSQLTKPGFFWLQSPNHGFAAANNLALQLLASVNTCTHALMLNNDAFLMPGSLQAALAFMQQRPGIGLLGFTILDFTNPTSIQYVGGKYNFFTGRLQLLEAGHPFVLPAKHHRNIDYPAGAAMMVSITAMKDVGYMDESFFLYGEEMDWSYRMRKKHWEVDYCFEATVTHIGSATIDGQKKNLSAIGDFYWLRSRLLLSKKRGGIAFFTFSICSLLFPLRRLLHGQWSRVHMYFWIMMNPEKQYKEFNAIHSSING